MFMDDEGWAMQMQGMAQAKPMLSIPVSSNSGVKRDTDAENKHSKHLWHMSEEELKREI